VSAVLVSWAFISCAGVGPLPADDEPVFAPLFGVLGDRREVQRAGQACLLGVVQRRAGGLALGETEGFTGAIQGRAGERVQRGVIRR
jgi:hypothetical protein